MKSLKKPYPLILLTISGFILSFVIYAFIMGFSAMMLGGCAGTQINWNVDKEALALIAANEAGYQLAQEFPGEAKIALDYANKVLGATDADSSANYLVEWKSYVLGLIGFDNPHYKRQLSKLLPQIELPEGSMPDMEWMNKVKPYIQEFVYGIEDALAESAEVDRGLWPDFPDLAPGLPTEPLAFLDLYVPTFYIESLAGETLRAE